MIDPHIPNKRLERLADRFKERIREDLLKQYGSEVSIYNNIETQLN